MWKEVFCYFLAYLIAGACYATQMFLSRPGTSKCILGFWNTLISCYRCLIQHFDPIYFFQSIKLLFLYPAPFSLRSHCLEPSEVTCSGSSLHVSAVTDLLRVVQVLSIQSSESCFFMPGARGGQERASDTLELKL